MRSSQREVKYECNISRLCSVRFIPRHTAGTVGIGQFSKFSKIPIPLHRTLWYGINTDTGHFGKFGRTSIRVPDTSESSIRHQYRYPPDVCIGIGSGIGTTSMLVSDTFSTTSTLYREILTSKHGCFLRDPVPTCRLLFFDLIHRSIVLCSPTQLLLQNRTG